MKSIILVALALAAVALAAPAEREVKIIRSDYQQEPDGSYEYVFETDDGTSRQERGELKQVVDEENKPRTILVVHGTYTYKKDDGSAESINYVADENGFRADGPSIPRALGARR